MMEGILIAATRGSADSAIYETLRREFLADDELNLLLPPFVRTGLPASFHNPACANARAARAASASAIRARRSSRRASSSGIDIPSSTSARSVASARAISSDTSAFNCASARSPHRQPGLPFRRDDPDEVRHMRNGRSGRGSTVRSPSSRALQIADLAVERDTPARAAIASSGRAAAPGRRGLGRHDSEDCSLP